MNRPQATAFAVVIVLMALVSWSPPAFAQAETHSVSGKVLSDEGKPIEGATIYGISYTRGGGYGGEDRTLTGADGSYVLELPAGNARISLQYNEWDAYDGREVAVDGDETGVDFTLKTPPPRTAIVEGRVLDRDGSPVEGATIRLDQGCCRYSADQGYGEGGSTGTGVAKPVPAAPEPASEPAPEESHETSNESSSSMAYGRDDVAIMPVPCCYHSGYGQSKTTGADGAFRFETYGGPIVLTAYAKGYAQERVELDAQDEAAVRKDVTLHKVPAADAILRGRVVDAATGQPLAGAQVNTNNLEWSRYEGATTAADGTYELKVVPGWTQVSVYPGYGQPESTPVEDAPLGASASSRLAAPQQGYYQHVAAMRLASGPNAHDVELEPKPKADVILQGYVVDPDAQKGIPGATISVWNQDTGDWGSATTDATGSYKMLVRPGHYTANAWAEGHLQGVTTFTIAQGEKLKRADVQAPEGETRWSPCDECHEERVAYADSASTPPVGTSAAVAPRESGEAADADKAAGSPAPTPVMAAGDGARTEGTAYAGSGGGLPEYNPAEAPHPDEGVAAARTENAVPAPGLLLAAAALGLAALVLARRK